MADKSRTEISTELLEELRRFAEEYGRSEEEMLEEAVARYLERLRGTAEEVEGPVWGEGVAVSEELPHDGFLTLIERMSRRFDVDEDEAVRIAVEEQHAFRSERAEREEEEEEEEEER
jgi:hypothetical protein